MMKPLRNRFVLCLSAALLLTSGAAEAEMVKVDFSGTIGIVTDTFGDLASSGIISGETPFTGTLVYDTGSPQWYEEPTFTGYWASSYRVDIGESLSWSSTGSGGGIVIQDNRTVGPDTWDMFDADQGGYASVNGKDIWMDAIVWMKDNSLASFSSMELPTADTLKGFNRDETFFRMAGYYENEKAWDLIGASEVSFTISKVEREASVPEPSTIALLGCVLTGVAAARKFGVES